ncbi:hypothetical protein HPHPA17_0757 [Helicobacter pylori Hp A-17]|nr:hypothetical protein HPHPA17_0757 [Helicobacter pylori Hp A-17]
MKRGLNASLALSNQRDKKNWYLKKRGDLILFRILFWDFVL